jgi:hypothetical protein
MNDQKKPSASTSADPARADARPAYERPRVTKKKAVTRATLFTGHGGPASGPPPLVAGG